MFDVDTRFQRAASIQNVKDQPFYCTASKDISDAPETHKAFRITPIAVSSWKIEVLVLKSVREVKSLEQDAECVWELDATFQQKHSRHPLVVWARVSPFTGKDELQKLRTYLRLFEKQTEQYDQHQRARREHAAAATAGELALA